MHILRDLFLYFWATKKNIDRDADSLLFKYNICTYVHQTSFTYDIF